MKELSVNGELILGNKTGFNCGDYGKRTSIIVIKNSEIITSVCENSMTSMLFLPSAKFQNLKKNVFLSESID